MKNIVRRALRHFIRSVAPHVGLGIFEMPAIESGNHPDDLDWNSTELAPDPRFLTAERITIH